METYKGYSIELIFGHLFSVFYLGDEILFESMDGAKEFIDSVWS